MGCLKSGGFGGKANKGPDTRLKKAGPLFMMITEIIASKFKGEFGNERKVI